MRYAAVTSRKDRIQSWSSEGPIRVAAEESLNVHDLGKDSEWCDLMDIKLNAIKTKIMIISRSCTSSSDKESDELDILEWHYI